MCSVEGLFVDGNKIELKTMYGEEKIKYIGSVMSVGLIAVC
jgi:hypothetical protein